MAKVDKNGPGGCWIWTGGTLDGYGWLWWQGRSQHAHRVSWTILVGPLRPDQILHHKCENRKCVNPNHLEATTRKHHTMTFHPNDICATNSRKTHCPHGHPYAEGNIVNLTRGNRECLTCHNQRTREWDARRKAKDPEAFNAAQRKRRAAAKAGMAAEKLEEFLAKERARSRAWRQNQKTKGK